MLWIIIFYSHICELFAHIYGNYAMSLLYIIMYIPHKLYSIYRTFMIKFEVIGGITYTIDNGKYIPHVERNKYYYINDIRPECYNKLLSDKIPINLNKEFMIPLRYIPGAVYDNYDQITIVKEDDFSDPVEYILYV